MKRIRLENLRKVRLFYTKLIDDFYNDQLSDNKFKLLIYGLNGLSKVIESADLELKIDNIIKELEMRKLKSSEKFSRSAMINLTKEISTIKNDITLARANHQMDVYDLLDESQRKIWLDKQNQFGHMKHKMRNKMQERRNW